jgi:hypothetical protein
MIGIPTFYAAVMFALAFVGVVSANAKELTYFCVKVPKHFRAKFSHIFVT